MIHDPIAYLCGIEDPEKVRAEALVYGVKVLRERPVTFLDGSTHRQLTVEYQGVQGYLHPTSKQARARQANYGRWLAPYSFVQTSR